MTGVSTLGQLLRQIDGISKQQATFATLSEQLATGKKTQKFSGLNTDALTSVRAHTELSSIDVYINNIIRANTTIALSLGTVEEFQAQTGEFANTLTNFVQQGSHQTGDDIYYDDPATPDIVESIIVGNTSANLDPEIQSVVNHANNLFDFLGELLNTKQADQFIFAGADGLTQPFTDNGTLDSALNTLIQQWKDGTITTDEFIADITDRDAFSGNPDALTDTVVGYSSSLSSDNAGRVFVRADENSEFEYTTLANEDSFRNLIVALAVIKNENLTPITDVYTNGVYTGTPDVQGAPGANSSEQEDNFYQLFNELVGVAVDSIDGIDTIRFRSETVRVQLNETQLAHTDQKNLLQNTISQIEEVDVNDVAVRLSVLQTQLEASYRVTAISQQLSLVNFI